MSRTFVFNSALAPYIRRLVEEKESTGSEALRTKWILKEIDDFATSYGLEEPVITKELIDAWRKTRINDCDSTLYTKYSIWSQLGKLMCRCGISCYILRLPKQPESKFVPIGIPRMDFLTDEDEKARLSELIFKKYPQLDNGKKNILYVPTFRDKAEDTAELIKATEELINFVNYDECNLIVDHHVVDTNKEEIYTSSRMNKEEGESFTGMEFMAVADYVVTDYSSIIFEALLKNLPVYLYCFDSDKYIDERGFYIDFWRDLPVLYSKNAKGICNFIAQGAKAADEKTDAFKEAYVNKRFDSITAVWAEIIDELIQGKYDNRYNYSNE